MTSPLVASAREAGASNRDWNDWCASDETQAAIDAHEGPHGRLVRECEAAFAEGRREHLRKSWIACWTTAPSDYDTFGTETVADAGAWLGKALREVLIDPRHLTYQRDRYGSGCHGSWLEDPRVEEARYQAQRATEMAEQAARDAKRAEGLIWLAGLDDAELQRVADGERDADLDTFGIGWTAVRDEKKRRAKEEAEVKRAGEWAALRPLIPEGCVLVDDGDEGSYSTEGGYAYRRPRRDACAYYGIRVVEIDQDVDRSYVSHSKGHISGSLADVAYQLGNGRLRVAAPGDVPPEKVLDRIGHDRLKEIRRVEVQGRVVWVGRPRFSYEALILDENGRIVRAKAIVAKLRGAP